MDVSDTKRLKALEEENGKLKRLLANAMLDNTALKDRSALPKMVTPALRRTAVAHLAETYEMSEVAACRVIAADRSSVRYRGQRPDDAALLERLRGLAAERRLFERYIPYPKNGRFPVKPARSPKNRRRQQGFLS